MPTPHIEAEVGSIAPIVITAGDPKRCQYIANKYLKNVVLVNSVRGMSAYTGEYKNKKITVFPVGMGMPSMGIYAYELYKFYDVEVMIRIGTCGSFNEDFKILDTVLLDGSYTESNFALSINRDNQTHLSYASPAVNQIIEEVAQEKNINYKKGYGLCNEAFDVYLTSEQLEDLFSSFPKSISIVVSEMEAFALFYLAKYFNRKASCLLTISDNIINKKAITAEERSKALTDMITLALEVVK